MPFVTRRDGVIAGFFAVAQPGTAEEWLDDDSPELVPSISQIIQSKWVQIQAERDRRSEFGGYKVGIKWFHSDQKSRAQQLALVLIGNQFVAGGGSLTDPLPNITAWKTMDGTDVTMTAELANQILSSAATQESKIFEAAKAHKVAMEASETPSVYDFTSGWPQAFGEEI